MRGFDGKELPCKECGGKCCYFAPIEKRVWDRVKHKVPEWSIIEQHCVGTSEEFYIAKVNTTDPSKDGLCAFLGDDKRCSIYNYRPRSCRAIGQQVPCPYAHPDQNKLYMERMEKNAEIRARKDGNNTEF